MHSLSILGRPVEASVLTGNPDAIRVWSDRADNTGQGFRTAAALLGSGAIVGGSVDETGPR